MAGDCARGRHYETVSCDLPTCENAECQVCACGGPWPCPDAVAPGSSYDTGPGVCIASHAEANAKADAMQRGGGKLTGCSLYVSTDPCEGCVRDYRNTTEVKAIYWPGGMVALP